MRKTIIVVALVLGFAVLFACKSQPESAAEMTETEQMFKGVYDQYRDSLILDGAKKHIVTKGEWLAHIALEEYHDGFYYPLIMLASSNVVLDPDLIRPGMELTVPSLRRNLEDPAARASLHEFLLKIADLEEARNRYDTAVIMRGHAGAIKD